MNRKSGQAWKDPIKVGDWVMYVDGNHDGCCWKC